MSPTLPSGLETLSRPQPSCFHMWLEVTKSNSAGNHGAYYKPLKWEITAFSKIRDSIKLKM